MINNGLDELAANAVELVVDERTAMAFAVYLSSKTAFGESNELVNLAKFNILQPTNVNWVTVFDKTADFGGAPLSECNIIELDGETLRVYAVNLKNLKYYFKDVDKRTLSVGELFLAYSSPMPREYSTVRPWRCNIHVGRILSEGECETFDEIIYKESKFGIVYYALLDWYGKMIMLYSSGELHPTEGLMFGWSQGKDCLNYTVLHTVEPKLAFEKTL